LQSCAYRWALFSTSAGEKKLGYAGLCKQLTQWRHDPETAWLADAPVHPLQQALKDRFKRKGQSESFRDPDAKQFEVDQVCLRELCL
jgi:putative transposase